VFPTQNLIGFLEREDGASIVEYALLLALVALVCVGAISLLGTGISGFFNTISTSI